MGLRLVAVALLVIAFAAGCQSPAPLDPKTGKPTSTNPDDFLIVDCLLPGQVRQLGGSMTYLSRRTPAKLSALHCRLQGGEYSLSGGSALAMWLPIAEQGDAAAQTNVGQIYERGIGVSPDYGTAAVWYRKAADQGYAPAALNLASLYAQGLGVGKDPQEAMAWYARATSTTGGVEIVVPSRDQLDEIATLRRQLGEKEAELARTRRELQELKSRLDKGSGASLREQRQLEQLRRERSQASNPGRVRELESEIAEREQRLSASERELATLRSSLENLQAASDVQQRTIGELEQKSADIPPQIQVDQPRLTLMRGASVVHVPAETRSIVVSGRADSVAGLSSLELNGRPLATVDGTFRTEIPAQRATVRIVATDRNLRRATTEFEIATGAEPERVVGHRIAEAPASFGTYHALVIGNDTYESLPKLETAANDARNVTAVLGDQYEFETTLLINATRFDVLSALNELRERLTEKDNLIIYYAGHGEIDRSNERGSWLPIDARQGSTENWLSNAAIADILNAMSVRQLLVVSDSCYAGTLAGSSRVRIAGAATESERIDAMRALTGQRSRMVLTSGGVEPVIDGVGGPNSVFARSFIELLERNVGVLSGGDLFEELRPEVSAAAAKRGIHQVPEYAPIKFAGHESGEFFFVRPN